MELSIKINKIKDCKLRDALSIPYALHYNPDNSKRQTREDFIKFINHDDILDDKIFDIFIDEMNDKPFYNFVKKRLNQNLTQNQKKKQTKKLKKLHDNHKKTKKK